SASASRSASSVLPDAVGPINDAMVFGGTGSIAVTRGARAPSAPAEKTLIQLAQRLYDERRPAVVALAGVLGDFHLTQQRVHLGDRQLAVCAHRRVARHRREHVVLTVADAIRRIVVRKIREDVDQ